MTWYREIENEAHARECLEEWFPDAKYPKEYAQLVAFLSGSGSYHGKFEKTLEQLSKLLWMEFLKIDSGSNRLTRSIQTLGGKFGFRSYLNSVGVDHRVYIGQLSKERFLSNVSERLLWKDSFGYGHGEFSHSYQWLAAGMFFEWGPFTAELYRHTLTLSREAMFVLGKGTITAEKDVPLWQWLVDCVRPRDASAPNGAGLRRIALCGHCFTDRTFRYANNVQSLLASKPEWFIGAYANHSTERIDRLTDEYKKKLLEQYGSMAKAKKELKVDTLSSGDIQRMALDKKYGGGVEGEVARPIRATGPVKPPPKLEYHGISAEQPPAETRMIVMNGRLVAI